VVVRRATHAAMTVCMSKSEYAEQVHAQAGKRDIDYLGTFDLEWLKESCDTFDEHEQGNDNKK